MIKVTILLRRAPSMAHDEFAVRQHVRRHVQCHAVPASIPGLPLVAFDGR